MHSLLARQIRRTLGTPEAIPESMAALLAAIDEAYRQADDDRLLLERSLDLTSEELLERNEQLSRDNDALAAREREIAEALSLQQATLESTADGILVVDRSGEIVSFNRRFAEMWGIPDNVLRSRDDGRAIEFVCDQLVDPAAFVAGIEELYGHPERESYDYLEFKDGKFFERYSRPQRVGDRCVGRVWSFRDVTERRRAERELRLSEERYRRLFEDDLTAIVVSRPDGTTEDCNPAWVRLFGFGSKAEALATNNALLYRRPEDRLALVETLRRRSRVENLQTEARRIDGEMVHVTATLIGRYDDGGALTGVMGFFSNETERRRLEEQLRLSQRLEAVGRLAGGVAHDFNNLLTAILGSAALIHDGLDPTDPLRVEAAEISRAGARAAELTRQLLAFSRKQVLDRRPLQLNAVVGEMERMLRRLIGENVELIVRLAPDLGIVDADPTQIEQVVTNLLVNAKDAVPGGGGTITIETADVTVDAAYRRRRPSVPEGSYVMLAVSDDGEGIAPELQERIFEPFFTTKDAGHGTGLGLAVVYGIVKQSGGFIWVYSERGLGTTFRVYLPRSRAAELPAVATGNRVERTDDLTGCESILLAEDEPLVRRLAARILRGRGYRVFEASTPNQALELMQAGAEPIDLLLTDVVMPGMSGPELADRVRRVRPSTPVIYMSGYSESLVQAQGLADPKRSTYVSKPFSTATLLRSVRAALAEASPERHLTAGEQGDERSVGIA